MNILDSQYQSSLALLTDLYQLTMAYGYWKTGPSDREAVFHLTFRRSPFGGGYTIAADDNPVDLSNASSTGFTFAGAVAGATDKRSHPAIRDYR